MKSTLSKAARRSRQAELVLSSASGAATAKRAAPAHQGIRVLETRFLPSTPSAPFSPRSQPPAIPQRLVPARSGDHAAIHQLLLSIFHGPSAAEFHAQLDEPLYEPTDRLLVKHGDEVVAHLRLTKRLIHFGSLTVPVAGFMDLGTSHEFRSRGFASALLDAGQQQASAEGALIGLTRTTAPELFLRQGWSVCGRHSFSIAGPRQILAHFCARYPEEDAGRDPEEDGARSILSPAVPRYIVRPLRRIELPSVMRLYEELSAGGYGSLVRSEAWWDWLMARGACDRAFVAVGPTGHSEPADRLAPVLGCVFVKEGRIVELLSRPGQDRVARLLAARVCADAVERNLASVRLDAPPGNPLHREWSAAGGQTRHASTCHGETCMARIFDPLSILRMLGETLLARAKAAGLARPFSLGLDIFHHDAGLTRSRHEDVRSYRLVVGQRRVKLTAGHPGRSYLSLTRRDLTPLLLGHWKVSEALAAGRIRASTRLAEDAAAALFPPLPWYRPPLDDLMA